MTGPRQAHHALTARIAALHDRHATLETRIRDEECRPCPAPSRLRALHARKLILKDEMAYYEGVLRLRAAGSGATA